MNKNLLIKTISLVMLLSFSSAYAAFTPTYLPNSSFWDGSRFYDEDNVYAYVEYAVYDTSVTTNPFDEEIGTGQYIYAYEVQNLGTNFAPITFFELIGGNASLASGIGSIEVTDDDIVPSNDGTSFTWKFDNGIFIATKRSAFMVFSSDYGPIPGAFRLGTLQEGGEEPPVIDTPEPASMALLAAGAVGILTRRNKNKK